MRIRSIEGLPGVYCPESWTKEDIYFLKSAYSKGYVQGEMSVREPILNALDIPNILDRLEDSIRYETQG